MPKTAVLFLHGIVGTPDHFNQFLPCVPQTHTVVKLLLDGHGGSVQDFSKTSMKKWKAQVEQAVNDLIETHDGLIIVGHSMGTLFAIQQAVFQPEKIKGVFLIASPLSICMRLRNFKNSIIACLGMEANDPIAKAAKEAYGVKPDRKVWRYLGWIPRYVELLSEIRKTRSLVEQIGIPCVVAQSRLDEVVALRAYRYFTNNPNAEIIILPDSGHYYYHPDDRAFLQTKFTDFIEKTSQ